MSDPRPPAGGRAPAAEPAAAPEPRGLAACATRREALARLAAVVGLAGVTPAGLAAFSLTGCGTPSSPPAPTLLRVPLAGLPPGGRLRVVYRGDPVELRREGDGVAARSLLCTHQGCEVKWQADQGRYHCPCHEGTYDASGKPIGGAPTRPLAAVPVRIEGTDAVVGVEEGR